MKSATRKADRSMITCDRNSKEGMLSSFDSSLITTPKDIDPRQKAKAVLNLVSSTCFTAEMPTCKPIKEPINVRAAIWKRTFPFVA
ncbi:MAG: hypothetical protein QW782_02955 [Candidatus Bathyarchaeia archaeon]